MASLGTPSCRSELQPGIKTFLCLPPNWSGELGEPAASPNDALRRIHIKSSALSEYGLQNVFSTHTVGRAQTHKQTKISPFITVSHP